MWQQQHPNDVKRYKNINICTKKATKIHTKEQQLKVLAERLEIEEEEK